MMIKLFVFVLIFGLLSGSTNAQYSEFAFDCHVLDDSRTLECSCQDSSINMSGVWYEKGDSLFWGYLYKQEFNFFMGNLTDSVYESFFGFYELRQWEKFLPPSNPLNLLPWIYLSVMPIEDTELFLIRIELFDLNEFKILSDKRILYSRSRGPVWGSVEFFTERKRNFPSF